MPTRIQALGTLRIEHDGETLDRLPAKRVRCALLVYLAIERSVTRDQLMGVFWGDRPPERARHLLNQTLYELRQDLGPDWVDSSGDYIRISDDVEIDAEAFARAVEDERWDEGLALYDGPFLAGSASAVSRALEGWFDDQSARLVRLHRRARRGAIEARVESGALQEGLALAREWAELDPLDDEAQHRLIELLAATGDRSGALRQYERHAKLVERELELEPLDQTRELVERIRQGEVGQRRDMRVAEPRPAYGAGPAEPAEAPREATPEPASVPAPAGATPPGAAAEAPQRHPARYPEPQLMDSLRSLRRRKVVRWTLAYLAVALVLLEGTSNLADAFGWPDVVLRVSTLLLGFGALVVLGYAWIQGEGRRERVSLVEVALTLAVVVFAGAAVNTARQPAPTAMAMEKPEEALDQRRIAVLFFDDYSPEQNLGPEAAGFTQTLISELGRVEGLTVLSRAAVAPYRNQPTPLDEIVQTLKAGLLVTGSITRMDERLRITFELIDGATKSTLYTDTLQRPASDVAALVADLPREVALVLREEVGGEITFRESRTGTDNSKAWTLVQRAEAEIEFEEAVWREDLGAGLARLRMADSMLAQAERLDPNWPEPIVRRGRIAAIRAKHTSDPPGGYEPGATREALAHMDRALRLDPEYAPALEARGLLRFHLAEIAGSERSRELYAEAEQDLLETVSLDPQRAAAWWTLSKLHRRQGRFAEAKHDARRALDADAFLEQAIGNLFQMFWTAFELEQLEEAEYWCAELRNRYPKQMSWAYCRLWMMGASPRMAADPDEAWRLADTLSAMAAASQRDIYNDWSRIYVAHTLARAGAEDSARAVLRRTFPDSIPDWAVYDVAHARLMLDEREPVYELLDRYVELYPSRRASLASDWFFRRLQGEDRFRALVGAPGPG